MHEDYPAKVEDVLLAVNKQRGTKLEDVSEWERLVIREYLSGASPQSPGFIQIFTKWDEEKKLNDGRGRQIEAAFTFTEEGIPADMEATTDRPYMRKLLIGDKQLSWIRKAMGFYRAYEEFLIQRNPGTAIGILAETKSKSVGELISFLLDDVSVRVRTQNSIDEINEEETNLKKGTGKAEPEKKDQQALPLTS